jgi:hypothetical protein
MKEINEIETVLKHSGIAAYLPKEVKARVCHGVAMDILAYYEPLIRQAKKDGYKQGVKDQYECQQIDLKQARQEGYTRGTKDQDKFREADLAQARQEVARQIFEVYDRYVKLLGEEIDELFGLAFAHGWRSKRVKTGSKCRADIQSLKSRFIAG